MGRCSVGRLVGGSVSKWSVVGWSVIGGFNKTHILQLYNEHILHILYSSYKLSHYFSLLSQFFYNIPL